jgi:PAS domain S-box-containing protein
MKPKRPLARKIFWIVLVPLAFEVSFLSAILLLLNRAEREYAAEAHAGEIIGKLNLCMTDMTGMGMFTYIYLLTGSERPLANAKQSSELMRQHIVPLQALVANDESSTRVKITEFLRMYEQSMHSVSTTAAISVKKMQASPPDSSRPVNKEGAVEEIRSGRDSSHQVANLGNKIISEQLEVSLLRGKKYEDFRHIVDLMLKIGIAVSFAISLGMTLYFNRYMRKRIETLMSNTVLYASNRPLSAPIEGDDEIAMLDEIFRASARALEESGRRERAVLQNAANVIFALDIGGRIQSINQSVEKLWGYKIEECLGARLSRFVVGSDAESVKEKLAEVTRSGDGNFESQLRKADGTLTDVLWALSFSQSDRTLAGVAHDISERKKIERLKLEFSDVMRRGLHVPLESIEALFKKMEASKDVLPEKAVVKAISSGREIGRLIRLLDDFVDIDVSTKAFSRENFQKSRVQDLMESASVSLKDWAAKRNVTITVQPSEAEVVADGAQIVRVLVNLVSNAIKFSPPEAEVIVMALLVDDGIEFQVVDKGPGIAPASQSAVFEKFKQLEQQPGTKSSGTGLGLAICQSIVSKHNGTIGVRSDGRTGSTFWFRLPAVELPVEGGGGQR